MALPKLLDDEGEMTQVLVDALEQIFNKYAVDKVMSREKIQQWSLDTNGAEKQLSEESIDEIFEYFDVDEANNLTFGGFLQLYQLQTENEPEETLNDLVSDHSICVRRSPKKSGRPSQQLIVIVQGKHGLVIGT
ncbi:hypothetical protein CYLTODRAFT_458538 [Cylindrobasidium torrendii FP15055 ss-10]|uniref:EF-hand domain-containing protein n=1 Tax=Cylindrobasidium torrendii FP15055 ss-10 TaxID=1314674 RepID=A0A0D7AY93_9AGAR|nr:hypothetical protein CYLTODRAFT_458538 [Cylindrobasidium torrendii FP15055 ss-10]